MNEEEEALNEEEGFIDYSELDRHKVLDFNKDRSNRWEKIPDFFDSPEDEEDEED